MRLKICVPYKDIWILDCINQIVQTKKALGYNSTPSFEIRRLLRNALLSDNVGKELDDQILLSTDTTPNTNMFLLPKELLACFISFVEVLFSTEVLRRDPPIRGEYARAFIGSGLFLIRDVNPEKPGEQLEVIFSDEKAKKELIDNWANFVSSEMKDANSDFSKYIGNLESTSEPIIE